MTGRRFVAASLALVVALAVLATAAPSAEAAAKVTAVGTVTCGPPSAGKAKIAPPFRSTPAAGTRTTTWKLRLTCKGTAGTGVEPISAKATAVTTAPASQVCGGPVTASALANEAAGQTVMDIKWKSNGKTKLNPTRIVFSNTFGPTALPSGLQYPGPNGSATVTGSFAGNEASWWAPFNPGENCTFSKGLTKVQTGATMNLLLTAARPAGTVMGFGSSHGGQLGDSGPTGRQWNPIQVGTGTDWVVASPAGARTCGIRGSGTLWCWGGAFPAPTQVGTATNWTDVSGRCARKGDGTLWCWQTCDPAVPQQVGTDTDWVDVAEDAGSIEGDECTGSSVSQACAVKSGGTLWCWLPEYTAPAQVGTDTDWADVSLGHWQETFTITSGPTVVTMCARKTDGSTWCGDPGTPPTQVGTDTDWAQVSSGGRNRCGVTTGGTMKCWSPGWDYPASPTVVGTVGVWSTVEMGRDHRCALRVNGTLWCWGLNWGGQRGVDGTQVVNSPRQVGTATNWATVRAGNNNACATRTDGTLWCWGENNSYDSGGLYRHLAPITGLATTRAVSSGSYHGCALRTNRTIWCWGESLSGQVGDNRPSSLGIESRSTPVQVLLGSDGSRGTNSWHTISMDGDMSCATRYDGSLWCWGDDPSPGLQVGSSNAWASVDVGADHVCGVQINGTLWCWGLGPLLGRGVIGNTTAPAPVNTATDWLSVSAARDSTCALKRNGSLWCWGFNGNGQLGDGTTTYRGTPVRVGTATWSSVVTRDTTCGIRTDGTLWCWGVNASGQIGDGTTTTRLAPVRVGTAADWTAVGTGGDLSGGEHTCGIRRPGNLWCWGEGSSGQLGDGTGIDRLTPTRVGSLSTWRAVDPTWVSTRAIRG